jgi:hypothetical protein
MGMKSYSLHRAPVGLWPSPSIDKEAISVCGQLDFTIVPDRAIADE